jgi:hypothetical protein
VGRRAIASILLEYGGFATILTDGPPGVCQPVPPMSVFTVMKPFCGVALIVTVFAWSAGVASAAPILPPGNSAANQYAQTLPGPGGNEAVGGRHEARSPAKVLGASTTERMRKLGPDGRAALQLAAETAPQTVHRRRSGPSSGAPANSSGSSGLGEILRQATGTLTSGSMGVLQPMILLVALVAACAYAIGRRRASPRDG